MTQGSIRAAATLLVVLTAALAPGANKVVTTKSGQTFEGEVTQSGDKVVITPKGGAKVTLHKDNVESIVDAASTEDQFRERLAKLSKKDSAGRVVLARWAIDRKEYDLALDALDGAIAIDPNNEEAIGFQRTVLKQRRLAPSPDAKGGTPAPGAGTAKQGARPAPAGGRPTRDPAGAPPAADPDAAPPADARRPRDADADEDRRPKKTRLVTQDEINRIRQLELADNETVTFRLQNDVRHRYLSSSDWEPKEFNKLTPAEQGMEILKNGSSRLHPDVVIATDPAALATFKSAVQRNVMSGCATSSCHGRGPTGVGGDKGGRFILHNPADKVPETYTNFLLMQDYRTTIDGKERAIIDRPRPENSLVLQYGLPLRDADTPHPEVQNFRPLFKGRNDPKYRAIEDWIGKSLAAVPPEYGIDLTKEPPGATTRPSRGGAERAEREQR